MAGERLVEAIQQAADGQIDRQTPADLVYGTVVSVAPLEIHIDDKFTVDAGKLVLSALCKPFTTDILIHKHKESGGAETDERLAAVTLWRGLQQGDRVRMLRCGGGQTYYVLDKEAGLP